MTYTLNMSDDNKIHVIQQSKGRVKLNGKYVSNIDARRSGLMSKCNCQTT